MLTKKYKRKKFSQFENEAIVVPSLHSRLFLGHQVREDRGVHRARVCDRGPRVRHVPGAGVRELHGAREPLSDLEKGRRCVRAHCEGRINFVKKQWSIIPPFERMTYDAIISGALLYFAVN